MKSLDLFGAVQQPQSSITFNDFYREFPRKKKPGDAEKAWVQMLKQGFKPLEIMEGLRRNLPDMLKKEARFVPYPASWLRGKEWMNQPDRGFTPEIRETDWQKHQRESMEALERAAYGDRHDERGSDTIDLRNSDWRTI